VVVSDYQLSLAIAGGQNAAWPLASPLAHRHQERDQLQEEEAGYGGQEWAEASGWRTRREMVWKPAEGGDAISAAEWSHAAEEQASPDEDVVPGEPTDATIEEAYAEAGEVPVTEEALHHPRPKVRHDAPATEGATHSARTDLHRLPAPGAGGGLVRVVCTERGAVSPARNARRGRVVPRCGLLGAGPPQEGVRAGIASGRRRRVGGGARGRIRLPDGKVGRRALNETTKARRSGPLARPSR